MSEQTFRHAWQEPDHADIFDATATFSLTELRHHYEGFNEFNLLMAHKKSISEHDFVEIGCATGELYRYLSAYHPEFNYRGFDISRPAIERAHQKYQHGIFEVCKPDLSDLITENFSPGVVWSRDVIHHQPNPFDYLSKLLSISNEVTIIRTRTRDKGASVLDPEMSCQLQYNSWVPYLIFNTDELVKAICEIISVKRMFVYKHYMQLGGLHNRFVPKDCYLSETGTAETALYIVRSKNSDTSPHVSVSSTNESRPPKHDPLWIRGLRYFCRKLIM